MGRETQFLAKTAELLDAVVVGAGFSGLYALYKLRDTLGLKVRALEAGSGVGGTWYWNRYPGCRCDVPSYLYSYSFAPELDQEWSWTEKYASQAEIERYLNHVADRFDLRRDIQFGTRVVSATYLDAESLWALGTEDGALLRARFFVSASGILSVPQLPTYPGMDSFEGRIFFTGRWPHEKVDFSGRRVGIIGTGSTGIQVVPIVAAEASHLTVFQRTPNYVIPARNGPTDPQLEREIKRIYPEIRRKERSSPLGHPEDPPTRSALEVSPEERDHLYEKCWKAGGFRILFESFKDLVTSREANDTISQFVASKIQERVGDPALAATLTPSHPFGTRRPAIDTGYYEAFTRDNVSLVDLRKHPIERMDSRGIHTCSTYHELDDLILATGFDALTGSLIKMNVRGRAGVRLEDHWQGGPRTSLGLASHGFPNLFMITGPQSGVQFNVARNIEQHVDWVTDCIAYVLKHGYASIEAERQAEDWWAECVLEAANATLIPQTDSWWVGSNVPGKPRVILRYVGGAVAYQQACTDVAQNGYRGFVLSRDLPAMDSRKKAAVAQAQVS